MTAGAVVSGAYFGDKMSPLSDTTNLAPAMAGSTLFDHIRHMVYTVTPSLIIALVVFLILGRSSGEANMDVVNDLQEGILANFNINLALLIPPLLVIVIVALKLPALPGLLGGVILGCIFGSMFQGVALADWFGIIHYGFAFADPDAVMPELVSLLERGGMDSMMWTINLIICAMCFGGVMDASGMLATLGNALLKVAKGTGALVTVTVVSCVFMNIIAGDQYLAIVLPGRMYKTAFEDAKLAPKNLSRVLEDAGTMTSNLVPWNTCGATMSTFLGVSQWGAGGYAPYAILCWLNPLVSIFYGFTGITMEKMTDEQYERILEEREKEKEEAAKALEA
jgi:NhaC family Na+:H+ antiporter